MNKHIELVEKWLADPSSVSKEELIATANAAYDTSYAAYAAGNFSKAAETASNAAACASWAAWADATYVSYVVTSIAEAAYCVAEYYKLVKEKTLEKRP